LIVYLDTSALVKAYVDEAGTETVLEHLRAADTAATHEIAYESFARPPRCCVCN